MNIKNNLSVILCLMIGLFFIVMSFQYNELRSYFLVGIGASMTIISLIEIIKEAIKNIRNE